MLIMPNRLTLMHVFLHPLIRANKELGFLRSNRWQQKEVLNLQQYWISYDIKLTIYLNLEYSCCYTALKGYPIFLWVK